MRYLLIVLATSLFFCQPVYAGDLLDLPRQATFKSGIVQLSGAGTITVGSKIQKPYHIFAQICPTETRLRVNLEENPLDLIFANGTIYDSQMTEQRIVKLFARIVALGALDPFFVLEILSGERSVLYSPYITMESDHAVQLNISPTESIALYEHWISDLRLFLGMADGSNDKELALAESFLKEILTALKADIQYTFHIQPDTKQITQIDILSQTTAPEERRCQVTILIASLEQPPSYG